MADGDQHIPVSLPGLNQGGSAALLDPLFSATTLNPATSSLPMDFWVWQYKVHMCPLSEPHQWDSCAYAHPGEKARRRHPSKYYAVHCPYSKLKKPCPAGEDCPCTHSLFEFWLHPTRFRTSICSRGSKCNRQTCFFAHSEADLRIVTTPAPDPLLAETALNALATTIPGSDEVELPQLDGSSLRHLIDLCMQQQPQQPPKHLQPGALSSPDYSSSSKGGLSAAQIVPDLGPQQQRMLQQQLQQQQLQQQQLLPSNFLPVGLSGLMRFLPDSDLDSAQLGVSVCSAFSQQEADLSMCPAWEPDKLPAPPGSVQQHVQQMHHMHQRQQQHQLQPVQRLAAAAAVGPQQHGGSIVASAAAVSAGGSPPHRTMGMWGDEVKVVPWDGLPSRTQQQVPRSQQQQQQYQAVGHAGGPGAGSMLVSQPSNGMLSNTSSNSHVLQLLSNSSLPTISAGPVGSTYASSPTMVYMQDPMDEGQMLQDIIMQPAGGPYGSATSSNTGYGSEQGCDGGASGQRQGGGMNSTVQRPEQLQVQRSSAMNQLMNNIQVLTRSTGSGQMPEGGVGAIGDDLRKLLSPADQKALVLYMLGHLQPN